MALIVEDGSIVSNANSWVSRADYIAYAASVGVTIVDDENADFELISAKDFIGNHEANLKGVKVQRDQPTAYPRDNLVINGWAWDSDEIPREVILCQMSYALDIHAGIDIYNPPQNPGLATKLERVEGAVTVEYAVGENTGQKLSRTSTGEALLSSLLKNNGMAVIRLVRA